MVAFVAVGLVAVVAVLAGEVVYAIKAPRLPETAPYDLRRVPQEDDATNVVWLGDSTVAGVGASSPEATVPLQVAQRGGEPVDVTVLAVSGATVAEVLNEQVPKIPAGTQRIYISAGANDTTGLTKRKDFERSYKALLAALPKEAAVTVLGVPDMGSPPRFLQPLRATAGLRGRQLDEIVRNAAVERGATYVDIKGSTGPAFRDDPKRYFAADKFHPSDDGYRLWTDAVVQAQR